MSHPSSPGRLLIILAIALAVVVSAGPTLVALLHAAVPLVLVGGIVAAILRLVWFFTTRF